MFKKKPNIKTLSPLRSSDRRKIADGIIRDFEIQPDKPATEDAEAQAAATAAHTALRASILPDNALSAKFQTYEGPEKKEVNGTLYVGAHGGGDQRVLWVKIGEKVYPTVYTLWHNPRLVPLLHTPSFVVEKLQTGAGLMTPGLAGPPFPKRARKGAIVAVASLENPSVPLVVGTCSIDISSLTETRGAKGEAVEPFHWSGDDLWDWCASGKKGSEPPESIDGWVDTEVNDAAESVDRLDIDDEVDGGVQLDVTSKQETPSQTLAESRRNPHVDGDSIPAEYRGNEEEDDDDDLVESVDHELTTPEIDHKFHQAFLYGVHNAMKQHPSDPKHGLTFPMSQSLVMSSLVLPYLPVFTPQLQASLVIKKTSWKNARKFIKQLEKEKVLLAKEQKNEVSVWDIDFGDRQIEAFKPYRLPKKGAGGTANGGVSASKESTSNGDRSIDDSVGQKLSVPTLYKATEALSPIFEVAETRKQYYTMSDVKQITTRYIESENLVGPSNKRMVTLNPVISNAVLSTDSKLDNEVLALGKIPRDALMERVIKKCHKCYAILRNDETLDSPKIKVRPGVPPSVGILIETRGGNKTMTIVHDLEPFYIQAQPLAEELRKSCASSTSVERWKGGKGDSVLVQGSQKDSVSKALEKRGISRGWIEMVDKTKKKK